MNVFNIFMSLIGGFQRYQSLTQKKTAVAKTLVHVLIKGIAKVLL